MIPATYANYFLASTGASAALIGLLFVAISLAPEATFGLHANVERRVLAGSAFTALLNIFFISLVALVPQTNLGYVGSIMAAIGFIHTLTMGRHFWKARNEGPRTRKLMLLVGSLVLYGWEGWFGLSLLRHAHNPDAISGLSYLLLGAYSIGVGRAWELLGAQDEGLLTLLGLRGVRTTAFSGETAHDASLPSSGTVATTPK